MTIRGTFEFPLRTRTSCEDDCFAAFDRPKSLPPCRVWPGMHKRSSPGTRLNAPSGSQIATSTLYRFLSRSRSSLLNRKDETVARNPPRKLIYIRYGNTTEIHVQRQVLRFKATIIIIYHCFFRASQIYKSLFSARDLERALAYWSFILSVTRNTRLCVINGLKD